MGPVPAEVRRCVDASCGLRFPTEADDPRAATCPRCGAEVVTTARFDLGAAGERDPAVGRCERTPDRIPDASRSLVVVADNLRSAHNVGALFRTADGIGAARVLLCGISAPADHAGVAKTALGAESAVPSTARPDGVEAVKALLTDGYEVWAMETTPSARGLDTVRSFPLRTAVVFGNEVHGVDPGILDIASHHGALPMRGLKASLNVSVAAGAALYWIAAHQH